MGHLYLGNILTEAARRCEWLATSLDQHPGRGLLSRLPPDVAATKPTVVGSPPPVGTREETQLLKWRRPRQTSEGMFSGHLCEQGTHSNMLTTGPQEVEALETSPGRQETPHAAVTQE